MKIELVTLDGIKFSADAYSVILPTAAGQITVMPGHEPLLSVVTPGVIAIRREKSAPDYHVEHYATFGGVVEVTDESVRVLVDEATHGDDINEAEAQKAHETALKMRSEAKNSVELDKAQQLVDRATARIDVARIRRHASRR
jgi:F-type H+-transporting ATPase subunit epsilon